MCGKQAKTAIILPSNHLQSVAFFLPLISKRAGALVCALSYRKLYSSYIKFS